MIAIVKPDGVAEVMNVFAENGEGLVHLGEVIAAAGDDRVVYNGHLDLAL